MLDAMGQSLTGCSLKKNNKNPHYPPTPKKPQHPSQLHLPSWGGGSTQIAQLRSVSLGPHLPPDPPSPLPYRSCLPGYGQHRRGAAMLRSCVPPRAKGCWPRQPHSKSKLFSTLCFMVSEKAGWSGTWWAHRAKIKSTS